MSSYVLLQPVFALALWTFLVLMLIPLSRARAVSAGTAEVDDFKFGAAPRVPDAVNVSNRNYMNLLELPVLFYVACLAFVAINAVSSVALGLAWAYVALRVLHSLIHLTYNKVVHRLSVFAISNFVLVALWVVLYRSVPG
jgi:hypothetical protein